MAVEHWMMFGSFAQQEYFAYPSADTYDGIILNANMVAHAPGGLASFLHEKTPGTKYIIDPLTHAFQHDPSTITGSKGKVKASVQRIADFYGNPFTDTVGNRPLKPSEASASIQDFVPQCIQFQLEHLVSFMENTDAAKYMDEEERQQPPYAVVAPYFYLSESTLDYWLPVNQESIEYASEHVERNSSKLFAAIVIDQGILADEDARSKLITAYTACDLDGYLLWVDNLNEMTASKNELAGLIHLTSELRLNKTREVINIHGGFFSIMASGELADGCMSGVCHGPEFGEYRGVVPVGGGIPISRYYVPQLHQRIRYTEAAALFSELGALVSAEAFHATICDCQVCQSVIQGNSENFSQFGDGNVKEIKRGNGIARLSYPTSKAREICLKHYLERKHREYISVRQCSRETIVRSVSKGYNDFVDVAGLDGVKHLRQWLSVFGEEILQ